MPSSQLLEIAVRIEIDIALGDRMVLVIVIKLYVLHLDNANSRYKSHSRQRKRKCDAMRCWKQKMKNQKRPFEEVDVSEEGLSSKW